MDSTTKLLEASIRLENLKKQKEDLLKSLERIENKIYHITLIKERFDKEVEANMIGV